MKHQSFIFAFLVLFAVPFGAFAQSDPSGVVTSLLPNVYAQSLTVQVQQNHVTGSFQAQNDDSSAISNLHYEASILDPLPEAKSDEIVPDDSVVYVHIVNSTPINLAPQESKTVPVDLQIPALPDKDYRLQIRLVTSNNRQLGWSDTIVHLSGSSDFVVGDATSVDVASVDPVTKEKSSTWEAMSGPNVDPHANITLVEHVTHIGKASVSVIPRLTDTRILVQNSEPVVQTLPAISLKGGEDTTLKFPFVASDVAGSHQVVLTFLEGNNPISTDSEFRYVVRGASATIGQQSVESMPSEKGASALIHFVVSASADRATWENVTNVVTIADSNGTVGSVTNTLKADHSTPGNATVVLDRALCGTPTVTISLIAADGKTIDTNAAEYPQFTSNAGCNVSVPQTSPLPSSHRDYTKLLITVLIIILLIIVVSIVMYGIGRKRKVNMGTKMLLLFILTAGSTLGIYVSNFHTVQANGIQYEIGIAAPQVLISLFVNSPKHNSAVSTGPVNYSGDFSWYDCDNTVRLGTIQVLVKQGSWKASLPRPLGKEWQKIASSSTQYYAGGKSHSWRHTQYNGKLTIPSSAVDAQGYTTLWTVGYASGFNGFGLPPDFRLPVPADHGQYASLCQKPYNPAIALECVADTYDAFGIMFDLTSVHFPVAPTPTITPKITPTPTPTPKITPTPTPKITPTPTPVSGNHPPVGVATISVNGGAFSSHVSVVQGTQVIIRLSANGSSDPDGWTTPRLGVSNGGKCEWNSDLNQGSPTFDTTVTNPSSSAACEISLGNMTFNDAPGTYTYNLLRITDDAAAQSNTGTASITVLPKGSVTPTPPPATSTPTPAFNSGIFNETR